MKQAQWVMNTEIGPLHLVASEKGLQGVFWKRQTAQVASSLRGDAAEIRFLAEAVKQFEEYFRAEREDFDIALDIVGTDFQKKVWQGLARIPYGATIAYKELAENIGAKGSARAVGTANGRNPLSVIIPCHRVIAADGTLGGYAGGLPVKARLLALEKSRGDATGRSR